MSLVWRLRGLALSLGCLAAGGMVATAERRLRTVEDEYFGLVTEPRCVQFGVRQTDKDRSRGWSPNRTPVEGLHGSRRIVTVGDSVTYGLGVAGAEAWPKVMGQDLMAQHPHQTLDIRNLSNVGWDAEQVACLVENFVEAWQPELVIYGVYNNDAQRTWAVHSALIDRPVFSAREEPDEIRLLPAPLTNWLLLHSAAWRRFAAVRFMRHIEESGPIHPQPDAFFEAQLQTLRDWSARTGVPVLALLLAPHPLANPETCPQHGGGADACANFQLRHETLRRLLDASEVPWADSLPLLQASGRDHFLLPGTQDPDHPDAAAHALYAQAIEPLVSATLRLDEPLDPALGRPASEGPRRPGSGRSRQRDRVRGPR